MHTQLTLNPAQLSRALTSLHPSISALVVGLHGIGKSQISCQIAEQLREKYPEHAWPVIDKRLAQMMDGDLTGIPDRDAIDTARQKNRPVTKFLPTDWWQQACDEPCVLILDELNRADAQMMNGGFQIVGSHELNGLKLHPLTRVIACVNPPTYYQVQEMDKALIDRFWVCFLEHSVDDWVSWARGKLDDALVDFIQESPQWLHHDPSKTAELEVAPTPRSWHFLDTALAHAEMQPSKFMGQTPPDLFTIYAHGLIGQGAAIAFAKWLGNREMFLTVENVLDEWQDGKIQKLAKRLRHEEILSCIDRLGEHSNDNDWSESQAQNVVDFAMTVLNDEDKLMLFTRVTRSKNRNNIKLLHASPITQCIVKAASEAHKLGQARNT